MKRERNKVLWVSPEDHQRIKTAAARQGMSIKEYIKYLGRIDEKAESNKKRFTGLL